MEAPEALSIEELREAWPALAPDDRVTGFKMLAPHEADDFFLSLSAFGQEQILEGLPKGERRLWMRLLAPDDATDVIQQAAPGFRPELLELLDEKTRIEVSALLAYAEDAAGGLMSPRFARVRPEMTVGETISYLRRQVRENPETIYYAYALDKEQRLLGVVSFRQVFSSPDDKIVSDIMIRDVVAAHENTDQEALARLFARHGFISIPVVDEHGRMKGIVTVDDIVDVVNEEATEDIQKLGGMEALDAPYLQTRFVPMVKKRAGWLAMLFIGEMLTATAMSFYEREIAQAVVLALFIPLIISSGGNSGSQATTLVIRAMALGEVKLRDWWRVVGREVSSGAALGGILGAIGFTRIVAWHVLFKSYGDQYLLVAITVALSLVGVVLWGTVAGSMLPFILKKLRFDPASASAPFVATLVDVSGLVIYFSVAHMVLGGSLL